MIRLVWQFDKLNYDELDNIISLDCFDLLNKFGLLIYWKCFYSFYFLCILIMSMVLGLKWNRCASRLAVISMKAVCLINLQTQLEEIFTYFLVNDGHFVLLMKSNHSLLIGIDWSYKKKIDFNQEGYLNWHLCCSNSMCERERERQRQKKTNAIFK